MPHAAKETSWRPCSAWDANVPSCGSSPINVDLAAALASLIETNAFGTYHATNAGDCSWFEFASEIFRLANLAVKVTPSTAAEYAAKARRPDYSVLDCDKLAEVLGRPLPPWQEALARYIAQP